MPDLLLNSSVNKVGTHLRERGTTGAIQWRFAEYIGHRTLNFLAGGTMHHQRMLKAAEWMLKIHEAGDRLDMSQWNETRGANYREMHLCGSAACFGGWLAVSPYFCKEGGYAGSFGEPLFPGCDSGDAMSSLAVYFDIDVDLADNLMFSGLPYGRAYLESVTALDVADKLVALVKEDLRND